MQTITISGREFSFSPRYTAGQSVVLTAGEASQFNQVLGENLRNNFAQVLKGKGSAWTVTEQNAEFATMQKEYQFGVRSVQESNPIEAEIYALAKKSFEATLRATGAVISKVAKPEYDAAYAKWLAPHRATLEPIAKDRLAEAEKTAKLLAGLGMELDFEKLR